MESNSIIPDEHPYLKGMMSLAGLSKRVYAVGVLPPERIVSVAVVGTRRPTNYGTQVACDFAEALARRGVVIISGLAYGIDTAAHQGALRANGITIAVLAHGLDQVYPKGNEALANDIVTHGGALISPYEQGTGVAKWRFLERNQWVAGLADAVLVIEAEERSGTKSTVRYALDQGKEVFAVPGPITSSQSKGPNALIKEGAHPALTPEDILEVIAPQLLTQGAQRRKGQTADQEAVLEALEHGSHSLDDLMAATGLSAASTLATLTVLELGAFIRPAPPSGWTLI